MKYQHYDKNNRPCVRARCENCNKWFWASVRYRKSNPKGYALFCSRKCFYESGRFNPPIGRGEDNPNWRGGFCVSRGYLIYSAGEHTGRFFHVVKVEKILGRRLRKGEAVHHFDGNKQNNNNSNLLVCTKSYHQWLEKKMAFIGKQILFAGGYN